MAIFPTCALLTLIAAVSGAQNGVISGRGTSPYAPQDAPCPPGPLLRPADGISSDESAYIQARHAKTAGPFNSFLASLNASFPNVSQAPVMAAAWSGGGYRALTLSAGARQAFDKRDSNASVAGIYQALTYESGLSGGAWFLGGVAADRYPTISYLRDKFYLPNIEQGLLTPGGLVGAVPNLLDIILGQLSAKQAAGFEVTLADVYGRLLGYNLLEGPEGGVALRFSDITSTANESSHNVPLTILTIRAVNDSNAGCNALQTPVLPQFEISPFEFGSWDTDIAAFTPTKYLGSRLQGGAPLTGNCTVGFDNVGFIQGASGNIFPASVCGFTDVIPLGIGSDLLTLVRTLEQALMRIRGPSNGVDIAGANIPNPFYNYSGTSKAYSQGSQISLVDGATSGQDVPIWPFLHRKVDVLFALEAGEPMLGVTSLYQTYTAAQAAGLTRMPMIPSPSTYDNATMPRFFGCDERDAMAIVFLPGYNYVYPNNIQASATQLSRDQILGLMADGHAAATANGTDGWATCVGCVSLSKSDVQLPESCQECFSKYCYKGM